jgi:hypothetical protein
MARATTGTNIDELGTELGIILDSFDVDLLYGVHVDNGVLHVDNLVVVLEGFHTVAVGSKHWGLIVFDPYRHSLHRLCLRAVFACVEDVYVHGTWILFIGEVLDFLRSG